MREQGNRGTREPDPSPERERWVNQSRDRKGVETARIIISNRGTLPVARSHDGLLPRLSGGEVFVHYVTQRLNIKRLAEEGIETLLQERLTFSRAERGRRGDQHGFA